MRNGELHRRSDMKGPNLILWANATRRFSVGLSLYRHGIIHRVGARPASGRERVVRKRRRFHGRVLEVIKANLRMDVRASDGARVMGRE